MALLGPFSSGFLYPSSSTLFSLPALIQAVYESLTYLCRFGTSSLFLDLREVSHLKCFDLQQLIIRVVISWWKTEAARKQKSKDYKRAINGGVFL